MKIAKKTTQFICHMLNGPSVLYTLPFFLKIYSLGCGGPLLLHTGFLVAESGDYSSVAVLGPLPAGASPAAEHRL